MKHDDDDAEDGFNSLKGGSTDSSAIEVYYDEWAGAYDQTLRDWDYQAPTEAASTLCRHLKPGADVLDVGCGTGMFARAMVGHLDCRIEGIDISAASLEIAGNQGDYEQLHRHDLQMTPLPLGDQAFDAAACVGVLTYIADATDLLEDLCRIVRPAGYFLFTQRDDRWTENDFDGLMNDFETRGLWTPLMVTEAKPYLPKTKNSANSSRSSTSSATSSAAFSDPTAHQPSRYSPVHLMSILPILPSIESFKNDSVFDGRRHMLSACTVSSPPLSPASPSPSLPWPM